jgi:FixJ family two-component response regulator
MRHQAAAIAAGCREMAMPVGKGGTVIVIEDDASMTQALDRILRLGGFVPRRYDSAETFLDDRGIDDAVCMIIDVQLPGMSGLALQERLASDGVTTPVIFITAFDEPETRAFAVQAGAAFLFKPFSGRLLLETIGKLDAARALPSPAAGN